MLFRSVLNQGTKALPIGVWLMIAIASGIFSSSAIQLLLFLQRRSTNTKIRQLQTRLQQQDEDIFTYTASAEPEREPDPVTNGSPFKQAWRNPIPTQTDNRPRNQPAPESIETENIDDWDEEPNQNNRLDWDEVPQPRRDDERNTASNTPLGKDNRDRMRSESSQSRQPESARIDEVYDADFRLIQPPYKQPPAKFEYIEEEDDDDEEVLEDRASSHPGNLDDEDWGFDFDDEAAEIEAKKAKNRKA